jgi:2-polyprenyl-6-methoxyphenol hydroxylase-like FAD-dependent oxidoreductase
MERSSDVVIVGGGIAGAAMAITLSRAGLDVILLERHAAYRDRVRGELMVPWGVAEAQRLGLLPVLLEAGSHWLTRRIAYDRRLHRSRRKPLPLPSTTCCQGSPARSPSISHLLAGRSATPPQPREHRCGWGCIQ